MQPQKRHNIDVYDLVLNGKGSLTGCGLHGCSHVSILFNRLIQYSWGGGGGGGNK